VSGVASPANFNLTNGAPWYNVAWSNRKSITISHTKVSGSSSLTNFPMVFSVTDPNLKTVANGGSVGRTDGKDILFTASDGVTKLNYQMEFYNPSNGNTIAWAQIPSVSTTVDTLVYIYYGNASASDQTNALGTWDSNYKAVYHLADNAATTTVTDSTGANNGAAQAN